MAKGIERIINSVFAGLTILALNSNAAYYPKTGNITRGNPKFKEIALTFDYEGGKRKVGIILDALKKENVKATFFVTGYMMKYYPDIVKRMANEGHEIESHTYSHRMLTAIKKLDEGIIKKELDKSSREFYKITGKNMNYWRAPGGYVNHDILRYAEDDGFRHVYWTIDSRDWKCKTGEEDAYEKRLLDNIEKDRYKGNGAIVIAHGYSRFSKKWPDVIKKLKEKYALVTLSRVIDDKDDYHIQIASKK